MRPRSSPSLAFQTLTALAMLRLASACNYDFDDFHGLAPPLLDSGASAQGGAAGTSALDAAGGRSGSAGSGQADAGRTGGSAGSAAAGGTAGTSGSGGASGSTGTGGTGAAGGSGGIGGSAGSGAAGGAGGTSGSAGSGTSGSGGTGGFSGAGGTGGGAVDASTDRTGGSGGTGGGGAGNAGTGGVSTDGSSTGGGSGTAGAGTAGAGTGGAGTGGTGTGGAAGGITPPDSGPPDVRIDVAGDVRPFDCASVGGQIYENHCYYAKTTPVTWEVGAKQSCAAPAHLVTITSLGENTFVTSILAGQSRWIGFYRPAGSPQTAAAFVWITGEQAMYRDWYSANGEPDYDGECVRLGPSNNWGDNPCSTAFPVICERE